MRTIVLLLGALVGACSAAPDPSPTSSPVVAPVVTPSPSSPPAQSPSALPGDTPEATAAATPAATATPATFEDGRHEVGQDIDPGTYRAVAEFEDPAEFCYWERVSSFGGNEDEMIANYAGVGPVVVTIAATDAGFISNSCGTWSADLSPLPGPVADGVWVVGSDIVPGHYEAERGSLCFWQRLSGFGGTAEEVLEVGTPDDPPAVQIGSMDVGFASTRCGVWENAGD